MSLHDVKSTPDLGTVGQLPKMEALGIKWQ